MLKEQLALVKTNNIISILEINNFTILKQFKVNNLNYGLFGFMHPSIFINFQAMMIECYKLEESI